METSLQANLAKLENLPTPAIVHDVTLANFSQKVTQHYKPIVLKDFAADWPIVLKAKKSLISAADYLKTFEQKQALNLVSLPESTGGRMFYSDDLSDMNFSVSNVTLSDCIDRMFEHNRNERHCLQSISIKQSCPALLSEIPNKLLPETQPFLWVGNNVTVAPHFDEANNIAVVAAGKRRFTLFPPEQVKNLYIGPLDFSPAGQPISLVNLRAPDLDKFPLYQHAYAEALSVELEAGDAIYIPTPWWHHVESLSNFNVLVNYWWSDTYHASQLPFPMLIHALQALNTMPQGQKKAWQQIMQFYVLEQDKSSCEHIPEAAQGILGKPNPNVANFVHKWLAKEIN
jgi:hypothetical protein